MLRSMTGFGTAKISTSSMIFNCEIRSINTRFFELNVKLSDEWRSYEPLIRELIRAKIPRGKLECRINVEKLAQDESGDIKINKKLVKKLIKANKKIKKEYSSIIPLSFKEILNYPGVQCVKEIDEKKLNKIFSKLINTALDQLIASKENEGERLRVNIQEKLNQIESIARDLLEKWPSVEKAHIEKIRFKFNEYVQNFDENRLSQEIASIIQRADVDEELVRLLSHVKECRNIINSNNIDTKGKRLDFYMQEFNREANTLGSKATDDYFNHAAVNLKVIIEQMREQIQNIE